MIFLSVGIGFVQGVQTARNLRNPTKFSVNTLLFSRLGNDRAVLPRLRVSDRVPHGLELIVDSLH